MRVAAIYDIHGNLPALEAVLAEIVREGADLLVVGGDVAAGPLPRETMDRLMALEMPARFVSGNADRYVVECFDGAPDPHLPPPAREPVEWTASRITRAHRDFLVGFEATVALDVDGLGEVLFCHATPHNDSDVFTAATPEDRVRALLGEVRQRVVVCGHTHMQFDRMAGEVRVVNAGSVGMPFGEPGAYWARLGPGVALRRTDYDLRRAAERIRAGGYPQAHDFAAHNVLAPPTAAQALAVFERWSE